jgi:hypothetical protein
MYGYDHSPFSVFDDGHTDTFTLVKRLKCYVKHHSWRVLYDRLGVGQRENMKTAWFDRKTGAQLAINPKRIVALLDGFEYFWIFMDCPYERSFFVLYNSFCYAQHIIHEKTGRWIVRYS